ncbi:DNA-binding response regulator, OmpR family, contains REC and winged-helix (wHTH) domain [Caminicella sporogenes DSM 14501]|uniref:Stage 0 sporulation protein A homolog n=1 Tax=Caminicella sporogenes DSM 14501 TaxID=1121266 RepID=A0A1M6NK27_9FIRM|nr:response regulator transcription factor [Caminicella sporogenes]RKD22174.1 DNA-binding response regulator [Caminicella sporogenes]SHJ96118.1 DNA-binding response regulator, OmpR family, contains REC and winged-helix (wHTH) domain [Caminicella sporogenes DSM 14501]
MFKIMVVEDDFKIAQIVKENLIKWAFDVKVVEDFSDILNVFNKYRPHLILMDINLPLYDGFYWCNQIRKFSKVPIIFISSRNTNMDIIMAINMGGDDFINKPFSIDVLIAKINAILRRTYSYMKVESDVIEYNNVFLSINDSCVLYEGKQVELTKNEFKIMYILMKNAGSIVSREKIMRSLWEDESFVDDNTLTVNINRLRKKLEEINIKDFIKTKKGQGYIIV